MKKTLIPFILLIGLLAIGRYYYHLEAEKKIQQIVHNLSSWVIVSYQDLDVNIQGEINLQNITVYNLRRQPLLQAKELQIKDYKIGNNQPIKLDVHINNMQFKIKPINQTGKFGFYELGYRQITGNFRIAYDYNDFANRLLFNFGVELEDIADMDLMLDLGNFDVEQWRYYLQDPDSIVFVKGEFNYHEDQLVKKLFAYIQKKKDLSEKELKQLVFSRIDEIEQNKDGMTKLGLGFTEQWKSFLLNPQNLSIQAHVEDGFSLRQMRLIPDKALLFDKLKLKFLINQ